MDPQALAGAVRESASRRVGIVKAHLVGRDRVKDSNVSGAVDEQERNFTAAGAIEPPYPFDVLSGLLELSNALRQCVDAYVTNIEGFGHHFIPSFDLESPDIDEKIRAALYLDKLRQHEELEAAGDARAQTFNPFPADEEVQAAKLKVAGRMRLEKSRLDNFFDFACVDSSFVELRRKTRQDIEVLGNGYWEVLRNFDRRKNPLGEIAQFTYVPAFSIRILPLDRELVTVNARVRTSPLSFDTFPIRKRHRRYVQIFERAQTFFKEFGDPRPISRVNGRVCTSFDADGSPVWEPGDGPATELIHYRIHSPRSAYGIPRWIGTLLEVMGSRAAGEVNYLYFDNKSVPPMALLVSGGGITQETVSYIQDYFENEIKGKSNFHKVLILEAEPAGGDPNGRVKIDLKPLTSAQHNDALFQAYDERNIDKIGESFRLPRMLRGNMRDFNRATADAALYFAETQVFNPEREQIDYFLDRQILSDMGICYWTFRSKAPSLRDPAELAPIINGAAQVGLITPEEGRQELAAVFNHEFRKINEPWTKKPINLTLAELQNGALGAAGFAGGFGKQEDGLDKADLTTGDLAVAGALLGGQYGPPKKKPKKKPEDEEKEASVLEKARELLSLRDQFVAEEARVAREAFLSVKLAEKAGPPPAPARRPAKSPAKKR